MYSVVCILVLSKFVIFVVLFDVSRGRGKRKEWRGERGEVSRGEGIAWVNDNPAPRAA